MSSDVTPALTPGEWTGVLANHEHLAAIREQFMDTPFSAHALAALLLYGEPFGFDAQDVEDETQVAAYCAAMAAELGRTGKTESANTFRLLGERHKARALRIAALLPPIGTVEPAADEGPG